MKLALWNDVISVSLHFENISFIAYCSFNYCTLKLCSFHLRYNNSLVLQVKPFLRKKGRKWLRHLLCPLGRVYNWHKFHLCILYKSWYPRGNGHLPLTFPSTRNVCWETFINQVLNPSKQYFSLAFKFCASTKLTFFPSMNLVSRQLDTLNKLCCTYKRYRSH